jgi:hypothetical protein
MAIVVLRLPDVKGESLERPQKCRLCKGEVLQRWGKVSKPLRDPQLRSAQVYRYHCCACRRTFRHYPQGVDQAEQSQRLSLPANATHLIDCMQAGQLVALCWVLGLSYRGIAMVLAAFGVKLCAMTAWRDSQELAEQKQRRRQWKPVRVLGVDGPYVRGMGGVQAVLVAVDLGEGRPVEIGYLDEHDPRAVRQLSSSMFISHAIKHTRFEEPVQNQGSEGSGSSVSSSHESKNG